MPNNKMERFTQRARRVLTLAQEYAEQYHYQYIGSEHMLMGGQSDRCPPAAMRADVGGMARFALPVLQIHKSRMNLPVRMRTAQ